jgi:hypothetical protein
MDDLDAPARPHSEASRWSEPKPRSLNAIRVIGLHDTEGGTASSIADYFHSPTADGSAHLVADDAETYRCLPDDVIPWAAPPCNSDGVHIEMCGWAHWSANDWHHHEAMLHRAAFQVSLWCKDYDIPPVHLTIAQLRAGQKGIVTHRDITYAYHQSTHTDPGLGFPMSYFIGLVQGYVTGGNDVTLEEVQKEVATALAAFENGGNLRLAGQPKPPAGRGYAGPGWDFADKILASDLTVPPGTKFEATVS